MLVMSVVRELCMFNASFLVHIVRKEAMDKKTAGQIVAENNAKMVGPEDGIRSYTELMSNDIYEGLKQTVQAALTNPFFEKRDFYIVQVKNIDPILKQPKIQTWARRSCPTPVYKQDVYKYYYQSDALEFLWCIPDKMRYYHILHNKQKYFEDKEWGTIAKFVCLMESGELLSWVKKENGEKPDALISIQDNA